MPRTAHSSSLRSPRAHPQCPISGGLPPRSRFDHADCSVSVCLLVLTPMHTHPSLQLCASYRTSFPSCSLLIPHGETKPCSLEAFALTCSVTSCLPSHLSSWCTECSHHPMATVMSCWGGRRKSLDLGFPGRRPSTSKSKPWLWHGCSGELPAELGASPLAPSTGLLKGLMHVTKASNPVLPEFVRYEAACLM